MKPWSVIKWSFICFIFYLCFLYVCGKRFDVDKAEREGNTLWLTLSQNGVWDYIFEWKRAFILANHVNKFLQLRSCKIMHQFTYIRIVTVKLWSKVWNLTLNIYIIKCIGCGNCINENEFLHSTRDEFKFISCIVKILLFFFFFTFILWKHFWSFIHKERFEASFTRSFEASLTCFGFIPRTSVIRHWQKDGQKQHRDVSFRPPSLTFHMWWACSWALEGGGEGAEWGAE